MVIITKQDGNFIFEIKGIHKLWSFKSQLIIPKEHILSAAHDVESISSWHGWRLPGTWIPSILTAGTFYKDGKRIFWDVANKENCITIDLQDEDYQQLIIEVEDPVSSINLLLNK